MEQTRKNYADDKARFLILKQPVDANPTAPAAVAVTSVAEAPTVEKLHIDKK